VVGSLAGYGYQTVTVQRETGSPETLWVPIVDGTVRLGVLRAVLDERVSGDDPVVRDGCLAIASLTGHLIQAKTALGDTIEFTRRTTPHDHRVGVAVSARAAVHVRVRSALDRRSARAQL
jgi:hypothetical protein